jgi:predicted Zn-ribbon and HTH transcriptional regulator
VAQFSSEEAALIDHIVRTALDRIHARRQTLSPNDVTRIQQEEARWTTHLATLRRRCHDCGQMFQASSCPWCGSTARGARPTHLW